jgi:hypothetical protein
MPLKQTQPRMTGEDGLLYDHVFPAALQISVDGNRQPYGHVIERVPEVPHVRSISAGVYDDLYGVDQYAK